MKPRRTVPSPSRLGWLDALRGLAALAVAMHHFGLVNLVHAPTEPYYLDLGVFGVMLFFLVSGYIIPASLERRGDVREFWAGRFFRIYPATILAVGIGLLALPRRYAVVQDYAFDHPLLSLAAHGMMLQDLLGVLSAIGVLWSLTYEMVFYFFVTALFVMGWHRRSAPIAIGFAAFALVLGSWLPLLTISTDLTATRHLVIAAGIVVVMAMACICTARPDLVRWGGLLLGGLGLTLVLLNSRSSAFETMTIFATMFAGTVLYRVEHGQTDRLPAILWCAFVIVCGFTAGLLYNHGTTLWKTWTDSWMAYSYAYAAAWAVFLAGMLLRRRRFPRWLSRLGAISFSVYLLHGPLIRFMGWQLSGRTPLTGWKAQGLQLAVFVAVLVVLSELGHRLVEIPFQNLGRKVVKAVNRRFPAPAAPAGPQDPPGVRAPESTAARVG